MQKSNQKARVIRARLTEAQYQDFVQKCAASGLSESELLRRLAAGVTVLDELPRKRVIAAHACSIQTLLNQIILDTDSTLAYQLQEEVSELCRNLS